MKTRTIVLDKELFLVLFDLVSQHLKNVEHDMDVQFFDDDSQSWRESKEQLRAEAEKSLPIVQRLYEAVLFGGV